MSIILTPFAKLLLLFYNMTNSYGIALLLFALVVRIVLFPLFLKGRKSMMAMNGLADQQKFLQQKYGRDRERYSIELQKLYEKEGVKPSGGCLWSFLPLAVLIPLYGIVRKPLTNLLGMTEDQFNSVSNLLYGQVLDINTSQLTMAQDVYLNYDRIVTSIPELAGMPQVDFTFLGMNMAEVPHLMFWQQENVLMAFGLWLIPVISAVLSVVSMILNNKINAYVMGTEKKSSDPTQKSMMVMMPLMSLWICFTLPAALGLYWIYSSLSAMLSEFANIPFLRKFLKTEAEKKVRRAEELKEMERLERERKSAAKKKAQEENRRIQMERKLNKSVSTASREGLRTYARGRTYDPDRYPTFPYEDPNKVLKKKYEEQAVAAEAAKEAKAAKKSGKKDKQAAPVAAAPVVEETVEKVTPVETAPVHTEPAAEVEEGFVEESFLEENEEA
ncbi:MAG: membrane protein insertase YidC [Ruminiclostridium sp.]|nr:membrane protein insertase YidC [Ruminiclostridium sp.]MBQ9933228.1 membrane protein insertase YidC [Ruminiclostridium sp.]